ADPLSECLNASNIDIASCSAVIASGDKDRDRLTSVYVYRGLAYFMKGESALAVVDFDEAIRLDGKLAYAAYTNRCAVKLGQGKDDAALADCSEAIRREPGYALSFSNRGGIYGKRREYDKALTDLNEAIRLEPKDAGALSNRGWVLSRL